MEYQLDCVERYKVKDAITGIQVYDEFDKFVCELSGNSLTHYLDDNDNLNEDELLQDIEDELDTEDFLVNAWI